MLAAFKESIVQFTLCDIVGIIAINAFASQISRRYFKRPLQAWFTIVFVLTFFIYLFTAVAKDIFKIRHRATLQKSTMIHFRDPKLTMENKVVIGANSSYTFLYDTLAAKAVIIPSGEILRIEESH